jgi:hypothetical protein
VLIGALLFFSDGIFHHSMARKTPTTHPLGGVSELKISLLYLEFSSSQVNCFTPVEPSPSILVITLFHELP